MRVSRRFSVLVLGLFVGACKAETKAPTPSPEVVSAPSSAPSSTPSSATEPEAALLELPPGFERCGALPCKRFETAEAALLGVLEDKPLVMGIGESHAQKGKEEVASATQRFKDKLLPLLAGKASDVVLEIWVADGKCGQEKEKKVAEAQKPVTQNQAKTNKNEFVELGDAAHQLGIKPHILKASCADYDAILKAGPDSVIVMLEMIARWMDEDVKALVEKNKKAGAEKMVLTYGGAIHNDMTARKGREKWTFGPDLKAATAGRYVELDLVVPEFIQDNDAWKALPWYAHFDKNAAPGKTTLMMTAKGAYVLFFAKS